MVAGRYNLWKQRAYVRVTNLATVAGYQHRLNLSWLPGMRSDFRDIRFTDIAGNKLRYWIESSINSTSAIVWILSPVAAIPGCMMYYGRNSVASESDITIFDAYDNFLGASLGAMWTGVGSVTVANGECVILKTGGVDARIYTNASFGTNIAMRARLKVAHYDAAAAQSELVQFYGTNERISAYYNSTSPYNATYYSTINGSNIQTSEILGGASNTYFVQDIIRNGSTSIIFKLNDANASTHTSYVATGSYPLRFVANGSNGDQVTVDWVIIRKTQATEPVLSVVWHGPNPGYSRTARSWVGTPVYSGTVYVWDPVNVDHGMTAGVGAQEIEMGPANVDHGMTAGVGVQEVEMGPVNIFHAMYPTATWDRIIAPLDDNPTMISVNISQGMDDPIMQAVFQYDTDTVGNIFGNDYMTAIVVKIPDYLGVLRPKFLGIAPSSRAEYKPAANKMQITAYDYGIYLTGNPLEEKDLVLLPPDDQNEDNLSARVLSYDYVTTPFQLGMHVIGGTSGATGTIIEIASGTSWRMTLYPAIGDFVDDEDLKVGGIKFAQADGRSVRIPYAPYYAKVYPETWIRSVLGGDNWMRVTGIEPYKIVSSNGYWDTDLCPAVPFMFGSKESINDAIIRLAKYMEYVKHIKIRDIGGGYYRPAFYWVPLSKIDDPSDGLDLPAMVSITGPNDPFLRAGFTLDQNGDKQVDKVKLWSQDINGNPLVASKGNSRANAGEGPIRTFYDEPTDIATQTDLNALCSDLFDLLSTRELTWSATLLARSDLELYQLLSISGYGTRIPDGIYRIVHIEHEKAGPKNLTHVKIMLATKFSTLMRYGATYKDSIAEVMRMIKKYDDKRPQTELGTCIANNGITVTYETEAKNKGKGRDGTATGSSAGSIKVGARITIQNTRGGVVCLPIIASSGSSTDLLTVDLPTIISAVVDQSDHNYWYLTWTAGANNTNVSVNIQTGSYPSAHGVVSGSGSSTSLYGKTTGVIRVRFSGPSATYYIKLWGERNGEYSATGVTATITSDASVTPPDAPEPPIIVGMIDLFLASGYWNTVSGGSRVIFSGTLPFMYDGSTNIYIGGAVQETDPTTWDPIDNLAQPSPRTMYVNSYITITGPNGSIGMHGLDGPARWWLYPINIKSILNPGANQVTITLTDPYASTDGGADWGISSLYIRSYYL